MNPSTMENLLRASEGEFSYADGSSAALVDLALQDSDGAIATSVLGELAQRVSNDARTVAAEILRRDSWDPHLTAYAHTVIYLRDPELAFSFMQKLVETVADKPIFEAMIDNVRLDAARFQQGEGHRFLEALRRKIALPQSLVALADELGGGPADGKDAKGR